VADQVKIRIQGEDGFSKTFDKAQAGLGRVDKAAKGTATAFNTLKAALGPVALALGGFQFSRFAADVLETGDQIGKLSARLGVSAEALSEYRFVAERSGVSFQGLTKSWQRFAVGIGDAVNGTGEAKDALVDLGIDAQKLAELPLDKQFEAVAAAMSRLTNDTERTTIAAKLFGQRGVELLQVMENGADGIRQLREEAVAAGLSMSGEAADAAEEYADAVTDLKASFKGFSETLVLDAAPALTTLVESLSKGQQSFKEFMDEVNAQESGWQKFAKFVGLDRTTGWDLWAKATGKAADETERLLNIGYELQSLRFVDEAPMDQAADAAVRLTDEITKWDGLDAGQMSEAMQLMRDESREAAAGLKEVGDAFDASDETLAILELNWQYEEAAANVKLWADEYREVDRAASETESALASAARGAASSIANSIGGAIMDTKRQLIDLGSIGRSVFGSLMGALVKMGLKIGLSSLGPGGAAVAGFLAEGGPALPGKAYVVGERGPELFVPSTAGAVVPNHQLAGAAAGTYNISINAGGGGIFTDAIVRRRTAEALVDEIERVQRYRGARK
jgi:hypothetical protein